jgi:transcriptional regulator with GAF, ATPase, and Fis domain
MEPDVEKDLLDAAELFAEVARQLLGERSMSETLQRIVDLAVEHLDQCEFAGVSYVEGRTITSPASSNEVPRIVDAIQSEVDEGPCIDAIREHEVFQTGDLAGETRWPSFARRAHAETGVSSILAVRLFAEQDTMGALNLYSTRRDAFGAVDAAFAAVFATHAAVAMDAAKREAQLERKAESRDLIGRAKGIVMSLLHVTEAEAFRMLRDVSQRLNLKLVEVARDVNETGQLPD